MDTWRNGDIGDVETSSEKRKPRRFSFSRLPFAYRTNVILSIVHLLTKKQMKLSV
jgi:hypothetical protein